MCVFLNESRNMDVRDFVANINPEFALNIELFEEHEDEENLEGELKEEYLKVRRQNWNEGDKWMKNHNEERKVIYNN